VTDILERREEFTQKIENSYEKLKEQFGVETYKDQLIKIFSKSLTKRLRFYRKKKLSGRV
jgi:threonyl-tRNA synthetase